MGKCISFLTRRSLWLSGMPLWFSVLFMSCDSGDIYPVDPETIVGISVEASFSFLNSETFPDKDSYDMIFGTFGSSNVPIVSKNISKPADGETVKVSLSDIPEGSSSIRLCLAKPGRQTFYTLYEMPLNAIPEDDLVIPEQTIDLIRYERVQQQVFNQCIVCHGGSGGVGADLYFTPGESYGNLVGIPAQKSAKNRVTPANVAGSFIIDVLKDRAGLRYDHSTGISGLKANDIVLLEEWIRTDAKNE